jgi:hypothetical protein
MAITRTVYTDRLSDVVVTTVTPRPTRRGRAVTTEERDAIVAMLSGGPWTFERMIGGAEAYWRRVQTVPDPAPLTKPWYARRILAKIRRVRRIIALVSATLDARNLEQWILEAIELGGEIAEAQWRFGLGDAARFGAKRLAQNRAAVPKGVRARQTLAEERARRIAAAVADYRRRHPRHTIRTVARNLASPTLGSETTIRRWFRQQQQQNG